MDDFSAVLDLLQNFGFSALFLWLYMIERKAHAETRARYFEDLREWAAISRAKSDSRAPKPDSH